jgi:hypothetical protein
MERIDLPIFGEGAQFFPPYVVVYEADGVDPWDFVISANIHRRHLTREQKGDVIATLVLQQPELSDRAIAKLAKVDHKTVGAVRAKTETAVNGEIPHKPAAEHVEAHVQVGHEPRVEQPEANGRTVHIAPAERIEASGRKARGRKPQPATKPAAPPAHCRDQARAALIDKLNTGKPRDVLHDIACCIADLSARWEQVPEFERRRAAARILTGLGLDTGARSIVFDSAAKAPAARVLK